MNTYASSPFLASNVFWCNHNTDKEPLSNSKDLPIRVSNKYNGLQAFPDRGRPPGRWRTEELNMQLWSIDYYSRQGTFEKAGLILGLLTKYRVYFFNFEILCSAEMWDLLLNVNLNSYVTGFWIVVPGQPTNVIGRATSAQSIQLTWEAPQTSADNLDSYEIYYNDSGRQIHINVSPPRNSYLVEDLTPNTKYTIRITARSSHGEGTHSSPVVIQTLEAG